MREPPSCGDRPHYKDAREFRANVGQRWGAAPRLASVAADRITLVSEGRHGSRALRPYSRTGTPGGAMPRFDVPRCGHTIGAVRITTRRRNRQSMRLRGYDCTSAGAYFVTICTRERLCSLEDAAWQAVLRTAWRRAVCGGTEPSPYDFVIMPNHVHGIVWLPARPSVRLRPGGVGAKRPRPRDVPRIPTGCGQPTRVRYLGAAPYLRL